MPNRDNVMGFRPAHGVGRQHVYWEFSINAANGTAVFIGDVVKLVAAGAVNPSAAGDATIVAGVVTQLFDTNRVTIGHPSSVVATKYLPASTAGYAIVALAIDGAIFIAQGQTGQTPAAADVGATTDHVAGAGDTTTAVSKHELNFGDLNTGGQFRIMGLVDEPGNTWAENADVYVMFNESAFMGSGAATGV